MITSLAKNIKCEKKFREIRHKVKNYNLWIKVEILQNKANFW